MPLPNFRKQMEPSELLGLERNVENFFDCLEERKTYLTHATRHGHIKFGVKADPKTIKKRLIAEKELVKFLKAIYITRMNRGDWKRFVENPATIPATMEMFRNEGGLALLTFMCYNSKILDPSNDSPAITLKIDLNADEIQEKTSLKYVLPRYLSTKCRIFLLRLWVADLLKTEDIPWQLEELEGSRFAKKPQLLKESVQRGMNESSAVDFIDRVLTSMPLLKSLLSGVGIKLNLTHKSDKSCTISTCKLVNSCALHLAKADGTLAEWPVNFLTALDTISPNLGAAVCKQYRFAVLTPPPADSKIPEYLVQRLQLEQNEIGGYNANSESTNPILNKYLKENQELMSMLPTLFGEQMMQRLNPQ